MNLFELLPTPGGLSVLYLVQTILFASMVYILGAEYLRTLSPDLVYKLIASFSIALLSLLSTGIYYLIQFDHLTPSDEFFPLIHNSIFVIIVLALARAFTYDFLSEKNQRLLDTYVNTNIAGIVLFYAIVQYFWSKNYHPGQNFKTSWLQFSFSIYFLVILFLLIWLSWRYRKRFRMRIITAFAAIVGVQIINLLHFFTGNTPAALKVLQAILPVLIPAMFGSVVFKELIAKNEKLLLALQQSLLSQKGMVQEMDRTCFELEKLADQILQKSNNSWSRLLDIKGLVEKLPQNAVILEKIRHQSREIEETAGQADALQSLVVRLQKTNTEIAGLISKMSESEIGEF